MTAPRPPQNTPTGAFALVERARFFNPRRMACVGEAVVVKSYRQGVIREGDLPRLIGEAAKLNLLRHRHIAAIRGVGCYGAGACGPAGRCSCASGWRSINDSDVVPSDAASAGQRAGPAPAGGANCCACSSVCGSLFYVEEYVGKRSLRSVVQAAASARPGDAACYSARCALRWCSQVRWLACVAVHTVTMPQTPLWLRSACRLPWLHGGDERPGHALHPQFISTW